MTRPSSEPILGPTHRPSIQGSAVADRLFRATILFFALCIPALLLLIFVEVGVAGWPALRKFGVHFLTSSTWDPVHGEFGAAPAIVGTILTSVIALVIATPLALGGAVFLSEFAPPWLRQPVSFVGRGGQEACPLLCLPEVEPRARGAPTRLAPNRVDV